MAEMETPSDWAEIVRVLSWFGPPISASNGPPASIPESLHSDWSLLKKHGYTDAEAWRAIQPSLTRLRIAQETATNGN